MAKASFESSCCMGLNSGASEQASERMSEAERAGERMSAAERASDASPAEKANELAVRADGPVHFFSIRYRFIRDSAWIFIRNLKQIKNKPSLVFS